MDRSEIVKMLLGKGIMPTPEAVEKAESGTAGRAPVAAPAKPAGLSLAVTRLGARTKDRLTPKDFLEQSLAVYQALQEKLLRKVKAMSVKNAKGASGQASVIGMVRERSEKGYVIEDTTGSMELVTDERLDAGSVIAVSGWVRGGRLFPERMAYPDVPMSFKARYLDAVIALSDGEAKDVDAVIGAARAAAGSEELALELPAYVDIRKGEETVRVLVVEAAHAVKKEDAVLWLRKRCLPQAGAADCGLIDPLPDILWIISDNDFWAENYKGVTIISSNPRKTGVRLNLRDRNTEPLGRA